MNHSTKAQEFLRAINSHDHLIKSYGLASSTINSHNKKPENRFSNDNEIVNILYQVMLHSPGYIFWKDIHSIYMGCNHNSAMLYGVNSPKDILGKTDYDLNHSSAKTFIEQDQYIIHTGNTHISETSIFVANSNKKLNLRTEKKPLYNTNGNIIGVIGNATDITKEQERKDLRWQHIMNQPKLDTQAIYKNFINQLANMLYKMQSTIINGTNINKVSLPNKNIILTKRERQILYLLSLNKSIKEIAKIIGKAEDKLIAPSTISSIIDKQLYPKFAANSISNLIEKANQLHLMPFIPDELIPYPKN